MQNMADMKQLLEKTSHPILSVYLQVDPALRENQAVNPAWRIWLKNALKELEQAEVKDHEAWTECRTRLEDFITSYKPVGRSLALFLGHDMRQVYELPVIVENSISFGEPALAPLIRAFDESHSFLLSYITHEHAEFFVMSQAGIEFQGELDIDIPREQWHELTLMPATAAGGSVRAGTHRDRFEDRIEEQEEHFYKEIAEEIYNLKENYSVHEIVLAGNEKSAHAVLKYLVDTAIIGPVTLAHYLSPAEMLQEIMPIVSENRLAEDLQLVQNTIDLAKSGGRAARGTEVLNAIDEHRVETLILPLVSSNQALVNKLSYDVLLRGGQVKLVTKNAADYLIEDCGIVASLYYQLPS